MSSAHRMQAYSPKAAVGSQVSFILVISGNTCSHVQVKGPSDEPGRGLHR